MYSFREEYGLPDLSPKSIKDLLDTMYTYSSDGKLFAERYVKNLFSGYKDVPKERKAEYEGFLSQNNLQFKCEMQYGTHY
jgi:hypothetical protein